MSERTDRKLVEVPVARFGYRHEAEFAAGFLEDAGIPYRLQIDDPALGMPLSASATLWVTAMDEQRAREVLDTEVEVLDAEAKSQSDWDIRQPSAGVEDGRAPSVAGGRGWVDRTGNIKSDLNIRQRTIALAGSAAALGALTLDAVREASAAVPVVLATVAGALFLVALLGHAPAFVKGILAAISGDTP